jgi:hypothetical protein
MVNFPCAVTVPSFTDFILTDYLKKIFFFVEKKIKNFFNII